MTLILVTKMICFALGEFMYCLVLPVLVRRGLSKLVSAALYVFVRNVFRLRIRHFRTYGDLVLNSTISFEYPCKCFLVI